MVRHCLRSGISIVPAFVFAFAQKAPRARRETTLPAIECMKREMSAAKIRFD